MKVSVVISAFNEEKLIGACLAGVRAAFAAAGGEWLLFIDADSALSAENLREALGLMRSYRFHTGGGLHPPGFTPRGTGAQPRA